MQDKTQKKKTQEKLNPSMYIYMYDNKATEWGMEFLPTWLHIK